MSRILRMLPWAAVLLSSAPPAEAHIIAARLGDFYTGALHPLTDLQDVLLWLALGLLAGAHGARGSRWLVLLMPAGLVLGFWLQHLLGLAPLGTLGNALLMVGLGALLAAGVRAHALGLGALALALSLIRGVVNADGMAPGTNPVLFVAGMATAGYVAITLVTALTMAFRGAAAETVPGWRAIALRVCGSWIAAIGLMIAGFALKAGGV